MENATAAATTSTPSFILIPDMLLVFVYLICTLIGLPGNIIAVLYFTRSVPKKDIASCLYTAVSMVDVAVSVCHLPVMISLMEARAPGLFGYPVVCVGWRLVFKSIQRLSVFLVLLLSISRTISLMRPLFIIRKRMVLGSLYGYMGYMVLEMAILAHKAEYIYDSWGVYCYENGMDSIYNKLTYSLLTFTLGVPAIFIFISFIISIVVIKQSMVSVLLECNAGRCKPGGNPLKKHATTTIMIFTFTYIICNFPHFLNMVFWTITMATPDGYPGPIYKGVFMNWYSWNICEIMSVVVNSALNPIVYFFRISQYHMWIKQSRVVKFFQQ